MAYLSEETADQKRFKLEAIEFVRLAAVRARKRQALREEFAGTYAAWGSYPNAA